MTPAPSDLLCFALYSAAHAVHAAYAPFLAPFGLTYPQYLVLTALAASDGQTVSGLGAELRLESNTLTPLLKRMEASGWLARRRDSLDDRKVRITLTGAGRALAVETAAMPGIFAAKTGLQPAELADLRDILAVLRDRLKPARA